MHKWLTAYRQRWLAPVPTNAPCMVCGTSYARMLKHRIAPDFAPDIYPADILKTLMHKNTGICACCGIVQSYNRPSAAQLHVVNAIGKDETTSDATYHETDNQAEHIEKFRRHHVEQRLLQWEKYFASRTVAPKRVLFIRHLFGDTIEFIKRRYNPEIAGIDMSQVCINHVKFHMPDVKMLSGEINGHLIGDFLHTEPYDAIFSWHILNHSCDVRSMLPQIDALLAPGGFWVMTDESAPKLHNPFHHFHPGERQLKMVLGEYFDGFDIIPNCKGKTEAFIAVANPRHDEADYVVWKRAAVK